MTEEIPTLGRRLDGYARRVAARAVADPPWGRPYEVLVEHLAELPSPDGRFARREVGGAEQAWRDEPEPPAVPPGRALPADVVAKLRRVVGPGVENMRVHDDDAADETARAHRADAVTVGTEVFFRHGRLNPQEPRGFALLAHEATHVVERSRPGPPAAEEGLARAREAAVLSGAASAEWPPAVPPLADAVRGTLATVDVPGFRTSGGLPAATGSFTMPGVAPPAAAAPTSSPQPMAAAVDRPVDPPPAAQQSIDVDALRGQIMRDLRRQLRDEYERGG